MATTRRAFIKAGVVGGVALAAVGAYEGWRFRDGTEDDSALGVEGRRLFAAVLPAFLADAVPSSALTPAVLAKALDGVEQTVRALPAAARGELRQLFVLLDQAPIRFALTGVWASWERVDVAQATAFLARWRTGKTTMLVSAYQGLHDICLGSWYADPAQWAGIGYPGPPSLLAGGVA